VIITDVFIPNPPRGFAFVTFSSARVCRELIKRDDFIVDGAHVALSIAVPKQQAMPARHSMSNLNYPFPRKSFFGQGPRAYHDPWENGHHMHSAAAARFNEVYDGRFDARSPVPSGSNSLATGLETLNINNMKPDVMNAAWKAFWSVAQSSPGPPANGGTGRPGSATTRIPQQQARPTAYHPASAPIHSGHHGAEVNHPGGSPSWR